jgi:murein DD-endopeptidase MepM/ murein hydrolase activator NlpD
MFKKKRCKGSEIDKTNTMKKQKFVYNVHTLSYERAEMSTQQKVLRVFGFLCAAAVSAFLFTLVMHNFFPSPKEKSLKQEISLLESEYSKLIQEVGTLQKALGNLQERDAYAYRMVFGMEPIDAQVMKGGIGGHDEYELFRRHDAGETIIEAREKVRQLRYQIAVQSRSLDTITQMAADKDKMWAARPSIKPVRSDKLSKSVNLLSGFGYRMHPVYKVMKKHQGIDFTAPKGTPIQATGDGVVVKAGWHYGYGNTVIIRHGYGYETLYGHMSRITVKNGQRVKRGQQIGTVGSTGTSTAPHCHYEVHERGKPVNPVQFVFDGLTPKEYQALVKAASVANQSFD